MNMAMVWAVFVAGEVGWVMEDARSVLGCFFRRIWLVAYGAFHEWNGVGLDARMWAWVGRV